MKKLLLFLITFAFIFLPLNIYAENSTIVDPGVGNSTIVVPGTGNSTVFDGNSTIVSKTYISSIELNANIIAPKAGDAVSTPNVTIASFNGNENPEGILSFSELQWQEVMGSGLFEKTNVTGTFEPGRTYVIRALVEVLDDNYEIDKTVAMYPITINGGYHLEQFQMNEMTLGVFIEEFRTPRKFTVNFVAPAEPIVYDFPHDGITVDEGSKITEPEVGPEMGWEVEGWYTDSGFTQRFNFTTDTITNNTTLYLKCVQNGASINPEPTFTITHNFNGGIYKGQGTFTHETAGFAPDIDEHFLYLDEMVLPTGKVFDYVLINGTKYTLGQTIMIDKNLTIEYYWKNTSTSEGNSTTPDPTPVDPTPVVYELITPVIEVVKGPNNTLYVNWQSNPAATRFEVYRSTNKKKWTKYNSTDATSYEQLKLTYGTTYYYKVKACNETKCTGYSNIASKKVVPDAVQNAKIVSTGAKSIKISWDKVSVTGYEVQRSTNATKGFKKVKTITKNGTLSYNNTKLKSATTYYYRLRAYKTVKGKKIYGGWSNVVSSITGPATPKKPTIKSPNFETITLDLKASKTATYYEVQRSTNKKKNFGTIGITKSLKFTDTVQTGTTFYYRVRACNTSDICSGWTSVVSKKAVVPKPSIKLDLSEQGLVTLSVKHVEGAEGYEIVRSTKKKKGYKPIYYLQDETTFINEVASSKTYYYKVRGYRYVNGKKVYSSYSSILTVKSKKINKNDKVASANRTAKIYLSVLPFSKKSLISQLEYEGYTNEIATQVVDKLPVNWNEEAAVMAMLLMQYNNYTTEELIDALENSEGFTHEEAVFGAENYNK